MKRSEMDYLRNILRARELNQKYFSYIDKATKNITKTLQLNPPVGLIPQKIFSGENF
jgi:hypothetical protein